jgi:membrane-associated protein
VHLLHHLRDFVLNYGYWAVAVALLAEHAGIPVPGESTLLVASFLAYSEHRLQVGWLVFIATCACALGGVFGYALGYFGGRPLVERYQNFFRIPSHALDRGELLFARYGASTVFFARFIFGMRVVIGPLAGVLHMQRRRFVVFNFLGAAAWAALISSAGYFFGHHWSTLVRTVSRVNVAAGLVAAGVVVYFLWRRRRSSQI